MVANGFYFMPLHATWIYDIDIYSGLCGGKGFLALATKIWVVWRTLPNRKIKKQNLAKVKKKTPHYNTKNENGIMRIQYRTSVL